VRAHRPILSPWRRWLLVELDRRPGVTARQLARSARHADRRVSAAVVYDRIRCAIVAGLVEQREHPGDPRRRALYLTPTGAELVLEVDRSRPVPVPSVAA
jgi:DNA-binding MarR family transcriptional regulator